MATLINIRRDVSDAFYRYKMERIQTKIEGKGNGIKTVVVNLSTVAQALARPGSYVIKYFGFELGAQTNVDPPDDRWIINGAHESAKLQDHLDGFINRFVLCSECKNPETDVIISDGLIDLDCKACGKRTSVDPRYKLSSFITKSAPKKGKKDKATRKAERKARKDAEADDEGSDNGSGEEPASPGANGDAATNGAAASDDENSAGTPEFTTNGADTKEPQWTVDMSAEAVKARQAELPIEFKQKLTLGGDDEEEEGGNSIYDDFGAWVQEQAEEKGSIDKVESIDIYLKAKELGIETKHRTVLVLVQTLFDKSICAQIPKRAAMLKQFGDSERHQRSLLGGTERFIVFGSDNKDDPELLPQIVKILQLYYTFDLLSEEVAEKWGTKASKKYVDMRMSKKIRKAAEPFLTWLAEAEEESDEGGSDEE